MCPQHEGLEAQQAMPTGSLAVDDAGSPVEETHAVSHRGAIAQHEDATTERKREINRLAPVFRLVPEILSEIFAYVSHDSDHPLHKYGWLKATHVSHRWREIALHSPRVWSHLHLASNMDCLKELIARSKDAPLYVTTGYPASKAKLDLVLGELHRIYTLTLDLDILQPEMTLPSPFNASELRELDVVDIIPSRSQTTLLSFNDCDLPKLNRLNLSSPTLCLSWTGAIFKSPITHLSLYHSLPPTSTLDETLETLSGMPYLKLLTLRDVLPPLFHGSARNVHLPHLEMIILADTCKRCYLLLQHITYPPTAVLRIGLRRSFSKSDIDQLSNQIATRLPDPRSSGASVRGLLISNDEVPVVAAWKKEIPCGELDPDFPADADVELALATQMRNFGAVLRRIIAPFPLSNVQTLYLGAGTSFSSRWKSLSRAMPNIRELGISSDREVDEEVLYLLTVESPKPGLPAPPPLFPRVEVLLLSGLMWYYRRDDFNPFMLQLLRKMLDSRKLAHCTIEELVLKKPLNIDEAGIATLHGSVGKVTWNPEDVRWGTTYSSSEYSDSDSDSGDDDGEGEDGDEGEGGGGGESEGEDEDEGDESGDE